MRSPHLFNADELRKWDCEAEVEKGKWAAARPLSCISLFTRIKLSWRVFRGQYDALKWTKQ